MSARERLLDLLLVGLLMACRLAMPEPKTSFKQPEAGHPTFEEYFDCKAEDVTIVISDWSHWTSTPRPAKLIEEEIRSELRKYVVVSEAERERLSHRVSLLGYSGYGTLELPDGIRAQWTQWSSFLSIQILGSSDSGDEFTLHFAPREWLKILEERE